MADLTYEIGDPTLTVNADISATYCGSVTTTYTMTPTPAAPWLTFDSLSTQLDIFTIDDSHENSYIITILASVSSADHGSAGGLSASVTFALDVTNTCKDQIISDINLYSYTVDDMQNFIGEAAVT